jgi:hypothetical protein
MFSHSASSSPPHIAPELLSEYAHSRHHTDSEHDPLGLVIPSLTLPPALSSDGGHGNETGRQSDSSRGGIRGGKRHHSRIHRHNPYGETLGNLELYIFGRKGAGKTAIANLLVDGNDDVISTAGWEGNTLTASTAWKNERLREGACNVRIIEVDGFDEEEDQASSLFI